MVVLGTYTTFLQVMGNLTRQTARTGIHNRAAALYARQDMYQLILFVLCLSYHINQVFALETHREHVLLLKAETVLNVINHSWSGGGNQCQHRHVIGNQTAQIGYLKIGGTKVIAPLGDAVRLIHAYHADIAHIA